MNEWDPELEQGIDWSDYERRLLYGILSIFFLLISIFAGLALTTWMPDFALWPWAPFAIGFLTYGVFWMRLMRFPCPSCQQPFFGEGAGFISPRSPFFTNNCANCGLEKRGSLDA